jgi:hypothetical protein
MSANKEQLDRADHGRSAKWRKKAKQQMNRLERRAARKQPEDAPKTRRYWGYET